MRPSEKKTDSALRFDYDLTLPRQKRIPVSIRIGYRLIALLKPVLGLRSIMRFALNAAWFFRRIAFELAGDYFGSSFAESGSGTIAPMLEKWIPAQGTVLELGCGTGRVSRMLARCARHVLSIDWDEGAIRLARQVAEQENTKNIEYRVGDIREPLGGNHFDIAVLVHILEVINEADKLLADLVKVTDTLLVEVTDFEAEALNSVRRHLGCVWYSDGPHVREYAEDTLRRQLNKNGWGVEQCDHRRGSIMVLAKRI